MFTTCFVCVPAVQPPLRSPVLRFSVSSSLRAARGVPAPIGPVRSAPAPGPRQASKASSNTALPMRTTAAPAAHGLAPIFAHAHRKPIEQGRLRGIEPGAQLGIQVREALEHGARRGRVALRRHGHEAAHPHVRKARAYVEQRAHVAGSQAAPCSPPPTRSPPRARPAPCPPPRRPRRSCGRGAPRKASGRARPTARCRGCGATGCCR